jgi:AcrR family transcriptional regulator
LIAAARQVFAARGFHGASIAEITAAADVAVGTFYVHFRDKEEVLNVLLDEGLGAFRAHVAATIAGAPRERAIPLLIRTIFHYAYAHRDLFRIVLTDTGIARGLQARDEMAKLLTSLLCAADMGRRLVGFDPPLIARFLSGVLAQGILWWSEHDAPGPDGMTAQVLRLLREGLPIPLVDAHNMK